MIEIPISSHNFVKVNLVSIKRGNKLYDIHKCLDCGLEGKRYSFSETVFVNRDKLNCPFRKKVKKAKVMIQQNIHLETQFGLKEGIYDIVEPLETYKDKYPESVWVFSEKIGEPVRLLPDEFIYVNKGNENEKES